MCVREKWARQRQLLLPRKTNEKSSSKQKSSQTKLQNNKKKMNNEAHIHKLQTKRRTASFPINCLSSIPSRSSNYRLGIGIPRHIVECNMHAAQIVDVRYAINKKMTTKNQLECAYGMSAHRQFIGITWIFLFVFLLFVVRI